MCRVFLDHYNVEFIKNKDMVNDELSEVVFTLDVMKNISKTKILQDINAKYNTIRISAE